MFEEQKEQQKLIFPSESQKESGPIEPGRIVITKQAIFKWLIVLIFMLYVLLSYYHAPILTRIGKYLIVSHNPQESGLLVCLAGGNIERGMATVDAYREGLASKVFLTREELPDGYELLRDEGLTYPESADLLRSLLQEAGIPESAIISSEIFVDSTLAEAKVVKKIVEEEDIKSIIILTSPTHSRRAWLTFREVLKENDVQIFMMPSKYSKFDPENWWKKRKYVKTVIIEYQKLIFYILRYYI